MFEVKELHGVLPALISPLTREGAVDEPAVRRLVEHVLAGGVHGLLPLGSTGEMASLDEPARRQVLAAVVEAAAGRVPVICGVAQTHLAAARAEVQAAARQGAMAVLVAPPFYYPIDQATVLGFYRRLAADSPLPILVYNIPQNTKVVVEPDTVGALAHEGTVVGIKDSSRDFEYFERVLLATRDLPGFRAFTGSDTMLMASVAMGGCGTICGAANVAPGLVVSVYEAAARGDWDAARTRQDRLIEVVMAVREGVFPAAIKAGVAMQGVCEPWPMPPVPALNEAATERLRQKLEGLLAPV
ncbi:MAG TPA: dihydrodipicolinate synthase family protein [Candidatus Dormibacteraeota bacterium]|jgi:4-hydroxy-tetrahydrodipicolinate synthase